MNTWSCGRDYLCWKVRGAEQDLITYVGQLELTDAAVERWIIDPDAHGLLDGPCNVM